MKPLALTHHTVRCPLDDRTARVTVRTNPDGYPSSRHLDVSTCSLQTSTPFMRSARTGYFPDVAPPVSYVCDVDPRPCHPEVACRKPCLAVLNAAEPGAAEPVRCTSGVSDALELARQTLPPGIMQSLWFHSG